MGLNLAQALRLISYKRDGYRTSDNYLPLGIPQAWSAAFVGAGGKSTAIFELARELPPPVIITTTTHFGSWQTSLADRHIVVKSASALSDFDPQGITLITGRITSDNRLPSMPLDALLWLRDMTQKRGWPLLIEADGAREKSLKAPAQHEPAIPDFSELVITVAGLSSLGMLLTTEFVHRPEVFAALSGLRLGEQITAQSLVRELTNKDGGLKNVPASARRVALLNQADTDAKQAQARGMMKSLLPVYDCVIIADLASSQVHASHEPTAGIVLAAGGAKRYGRTKQLLDWHGEPFVRAVARTALSAGLWPVVVVIGYDGGSVTEALDNLQVQVVTNDDWESGQASSLRAGLKSLPDNVGATVFMLADQPQVSHDVVQALVETHAAGLHPIVAPLVMMEQRGNPVLFDRVTFPDLIALQGDVGGRAIFSKYPVEYMPWHDDRLLLDVDTEQDYKRLTEDDSL